MTGPVCQDMRRCFAGAPAAVERRLAETAPALDALRRWREDGTHPFLTLPGRRDDLAGLRAFVARCRSRFDRMALLGIGGASLGGQVLAALGAERERVVFFDNGDGASLDRLLAAPDAHRTFFLVATKSGRSTETLAQAAIVLDAVPSEQIAVLTQPGESPARRLAERLGLTVLDHDPQLGGRYAVLGAPGSLPALFAGVDPAAARSGAAMVLDAALDAPAPASSAPALGAATLVAAMDAGRTGAVLLVYGPDLGALGRWHAQLWAESLGKRGRGSTPIPARGPADEHSQLQLWLDGPADKLFTVVEAPDPTPRRIPARMAREMGAGYLADRTMGATAAAQAQATADALARAGHPVRRLVLPAADARAVGGLLMHFMLETVIAARLLDVNPFDQPAVERSKLAVRNYLEDAS